MFKFTDEMGRIIDHDNIKSEKFTDLQETEAREYLSRD